MLKYGSFGLADVESIKKENSKKKRIDVRIVPFKGEIIFLFIYLFTFFFLPIWWNYALRLRKISGNSSYDQISKFKFFFSHLQNHSRKSTAELQ